MNQSTRRDKGLLRLPVPMIRVTVLLISTAPLMAEEPKPVYRSFEVSETAGIRRRSDVVTAITSLPDSASAETRFQLLRSETPLAAQFRVVESESHRRLITDFIDDFAPFETQRYTLVINAEDSVDEPPPGLTLKTTPDDFHINSAGVLDWIIPRDLQGLLQFSYQNRDYIQPDSVGLFFTDDSGATHQLAERAPDSAIVERDGPIASSLRFDYADWPPATQSLVQLEFYRTKSWVHVVWTVEGSADRLRTMGAGLNLVIEGPEVLVDFGAGDFVYTTVRGAQTTQLRTRRRSEVDIDWRVLHGTEDALVPIVVAPRHDAPPRVPGWAHVMGEHRCTALALADFTKSTAGQIEVAGNGRLSWVREFSSDTNPELEARTLEFWLHFVTMPVHIGARTSPRSMQELLEVTWDNE